MTDVTIPYQNVKEKIYDRQIRLWGLETQNLMAKSNILIIGLNGINIEVCKNLILSGINISIIDNKKIDKENIDNIYFLEESFENEYLCSAVFKELKSINKFINISAYIGAYDDENNIIIIDEHLIYNDKQEIESKIIKKSYDFQFLKNYNLICMSCENNPLYTLKNINNYCHDENIGFCATMCNGKFAFLFSDYNCHIINESYFKKKKKDIKNINTLNSSEHNKNIDMKSNKNVQNIDIISNNEKNLNKDNIQTKDIIDNKDVVDNTIKNTEVETIKINYCKLSNFLNASIKNFHKKTNQIIYLMFALVLFEEYKKINQTNLNINENDFILFCKKFPINNETLKELCQMYKLSLSISCSVMGGVVSEEIRKFVSKKHETIPNFCVFDMNQSIVTTLMIS